MSVHPFVLVTAMALCSVAGGLAFKAFAESRDVLMLVAGFAIYALSNIAFILIMDQTGLARAMVIAATAQIILTTAAAFLIFGERIGPASWCAVAFACLAVVAASLDQRTSSNSSSSKSPAIQTQEADHANGKN